MTARLGYLMKAKRAADEASEALRLMIEHDLSVRVPDGPEMLALREIAAGRMFSAGGYLDSAVPKPRMSAVDSGVGQRLATHIAEKLGDRPPRGWETGR